MNKKSNKVGTVTSFNKSIPQVHLLTFFGRFGTLAIMVLEIFCGAVFNLCLMQIKHNNLIIICDIYYTLQGILKGEVLLYH